MVLSAETKEAYARGVRHLLEALKETYFIADKCYDSIEIMEKLRKLKITSAIRVKGTFRKEVKHPLRKKSKVFWEEYGKQRYLIESLFGTIKLKLGSHFKVKDKEIAQKMGLGVFVLYNMYLWVALFMFLVLVKLARVTTIFRDYL
ncbi:transposase [Desulfurobacterium sp.]|uniref:transposase n=1 Tax=Desulfurobacterium sp. TaxID=2004706 RepID=UPI002615951F|nr:transposase [Desulfurobacterium sp.]